MSALSGRRETIKRVSQLHLVLGEEDLFIERAIAGVLRSARQQAGTVDIPIDRLRAGEVSTSELAELLSPSLFSDERVVVLEAAVLGLPMVLSDRVGAIGPSSIARPDANALVYPFGDIEALARAIARLRDDQALRLKMGQASLDISADHSGAKSVAAVIAVCA